MIKINFQQRNWAGEHCNKYNLRNPQNPTDVNKLYKKSFGVTRIKMNDDFLRSLRMDINILEVGTNVGAQLQTLQKMGFLNLYGIEINRKAIETSKKISKNIDIIRASALDIPFKDNYFDLVFTSGVLKKLSQKSIGALKIIFGVLNIMPMPMRKCHIGEIRTCF